MSARTLPLSFAGEVALVTGAASGIGAATTELLAGAGLRVLAVDRTPVSQAGVTPVTADITDEATLTEAIGRHLGDTALSYVVNCAGILVSSGFDDSTAEQWRRTLDVNLFGAFAVTRAEASRVLALVNPDPTPHYAASKAGLEMLTRSMARALGDDGVRVNAVAPGAVATPMALTDHHNVGGGMPATLRARVPMHRYAAPGEIAGCVAFLLSDQASYITGSTLLVDGGFSTT